jgi:peptide/nickel transport system permease protein
MTTTRLADIPKRQKQVRLRFGVNWPLLIGTLLVAFVVALAIFGPNIAPNDSLQENLLVQDDGGQWHIPPFPAFTVSGFPLGSDEFGRDLYSRLLWAVRPTLQMVAVVATVRLVLGTVVGLIAGWSSGRAGRFFDTLIGGALALPGLLVALGAIAVVGVELGIIAFIIGLSITGWAETARIVREQTRAIRGQLFVEAARAMGSSDTQIVFRHVLRQIASMIWMLLAFEIGSTLMLTAGLGFLGYYIGGDVWVDVEDFVARRTSGAPELGQMLATAWVRLTDPWGLVSVGSVVFVAVLGFNLVGEGLRLRISPEAQVGRIKWMKERTANLRLWLDDRFWYPVGQFLFGQRLAFGLLMFTAGAALGASGVWGWKQGVFMLDAPQVAFLYGDSSSTQTPQPTQGPATATPAVQDIIDANALTALSEPMVVWQVDVNSAFIGAPVIGPDNTVYTTSADNQLRAFDPEGELLWQIELEERPVGTPGIAPDGTIYATDKAGALNAVSPIGEIVWRFEIDPPRSATSGPTLGADGTIYYALGAQAGLMQAVSQNGEGLWLGQGKTFSYFKAPVVHPASGLVFLWDDIFNTSDGALQEFEFPTEVDRFLVGGDGKLYMRTGHTVAEWRVVGGSPEILQSISWNYTAFISEGIFPQQTGVTKNQVSWELYTTEFGGSTTIYWIEMVDGEGQLLGSASAPVSQGKVLFMDDQTLTAVVCGLGDFEFQRQNSPKPECHAIRPGEDESLWMIQIEENGVIVGASYREGMLYITTQEGKLFVVDESPKPVETAFGLPTEELAETQASGTTGGATLTGSGWLLDFPEPISAGPFILDDGGGYLLSESNQIYIFTADGEIRKVITLPTLPHQFEFQGFGGGLTVTPVPPFITTDDLLIVVSSDKVYGLNPDESLRWEAPLQDPPFSFPAGGPVEGVFYQIDTLGTLYAFSVSEGLLWKHDPEEGLKGASPAPVFGPQGNIYYTITNGTKGMVEALSPEGDFLWRAELKTFNFFRPIQISPDGNWLAVDDDVVYTQTGNLQDIESQLEFQIDQFITGEDGKTYLRSGNTIIQWEIDNGQFRNLHQFTFSTAGIRTFADPTVTVSPEGIFWFRLATSRVVNLWVNQEGQVVAFVQWPRRDERLLEEDPVRMTLSVCDPILEENRMDCRGYALGSTEPVWELSIQGIGRADRLIYENGTLFAQVDGDTIQVVKVDLP